VVRRERIGLLGGTFDPPHAGHLRAAEAARDQLELDRVLLVVANHPWQKTPVRTISPAADRLEMVRAGCEGRPGLEASSLEIDRGGPSYTLDTVREIRALSAREGRPDPDLYLVIGADLVPTLPSWHRWPELRDLVTLAIVPRPHAAVSGPPGGGARWCVVGGVDVDVSSSELRDLLRRGAPVDGLVSDAVIHCIQRLGLYSMEK